MSRNGRTTTRRRDMKYRLITALTLALVVGVAGPAMAKGQGGPGQAEIS